MGKNVLKIGVSARIPISPLIFGVRMTFEIPKESALDEESIAFLNIFLSLTVREIFAKNARNSNLITHIQGCSATRNEVPPDFFTPGDAHWLELQGKPQLGNIKWAS